MAHNLKTFASNTKAWHGLGTIVDSPMTTREAIILGGLDYEVSKQPVATASGTIIPGYNFTYRTDNKEILGVVGDGYTVVQNTAVFEFFDPLIGDSAKIETVGSLGKGEKIFIASKLPHNILVGRDDLTEMYVLLTNSHNGTGSVIAMITPIRVVCQNTLNMALSKNISNRISIRHTKHHKDRLAQAGEIMRLSLSYQTSLQEAYNLLYKKSVSDSVAKELIRKIVQEDRKDSTRCDNILDKVSSCYFTGVGQESIVGTAWGLFNGITHYLSHDKSYRNEESKFQSILGSGASEKMIKQTFDTLIKL